MALRYLRNFRCLISVGHCRYHRFARHLNLEAAQKLKQVRFV